MARPTPPTHDAATLWNSVGANYEIAFKDVRPQLESLEWIVSELSASGLKTAKCLDVGSGTGRPVCQHLADAGHDSLGIDISPEMVKAAKSRVPNARFEVANAIVWNPPNGPASYDVITAYFSMIANYTQNEIKEVIQRIYSWLKPGGFFVFATVPVPGNNTEITWMGREVVVSGLKAEEYGEWFRQVGFEVVKEDMSMFLPKAAVAGLVEKDVDVWEEPHLFIHARKK